MSASTEETRYARRWWVMAAAGLGTFAATLNVSIINISLPAIQTALHTTLATVEWVVLTYSLILAILLVTVGRLSDIVGRKTLFVVGAAIFAAGSLLCGISGSILQLIVSRGVQSVGGAFLVANSTAIVTDAFPPKELGKALGILGSIVAIGTTVGPSLGGLILDRAGWPLIFFVSVPVGLLTMGLAAVVLRQRRTGTRQRFDLIGAVTLAIFLSTLLLGITNGQEAGWTSPQVETLFLVSIVFGVLFLRIQSRARQPILDMRLFQNRLIAAALLSALLYFVAISTNTFLMPFLLQRVLGYSGQQAGLLLISVPLTIALIAPLSGWLSDQMGSRLLAVLGLAAGGLALFWLSRLGPDASAQDIVPRLMLLGLGSGMFQSPNNSSLMGAVSAEQRGVAAGLLATSRHLGLMFGTALAGAVWVSRSAYYAAAAGRAPTDVPQTALLGGIQDALLLAGVVCGLAIFLAWSRGRLAPRVKAPLVAEAQE